MIKKLARLALLLAVAITVPAQGAATVGLGLCMALGHHGGSLVQAVQDMTQVDGAEHDTQAAGSIDHGDAGGAMGAQCVACAAAASVSLSLDLLPGSVPDAAVDAALLGPPPDFLSGAPGRPPLAPRA